MTKDVLITISGLHHEENMLTKEEETEPVEVLSPATYYLKNGKHYILYEEPVEGSSGIIRNKIKIKEDEFLEVTKSGVTNTHMLFEKGKLSVTQYETPYGSIIVGTHTKELKVKTAEDQIDVYVQYALDVSGDKVADCEIRIKIESKLGTE